MDRRKRTASPGLNLRQSKFVSEYLVDGVGKAAAERAGYSPRSAESAASALLKRPKVREAIEELTKAHRARNEVTAQRVLQQAARIAFADPRLYVDDRGELIPLHKLSDDAAAALQGLEVDQAGNGCLKHRYKLVDKGAALERLMRHLGLFERDNVQSVDAVGQLLASIHSTGSRITLKK